MFIYFVNIYTCSCNKQLCYVQFVSQSNEINLEAIRVFKPRIRKRKKKGFFAAKATAHHRAPSLAWSSAAWTTLRWRCFDPMDRSQQPFGLAATALQLGLGLGWIMNGPEAPSLLQQARIPQPGPICQQAFMLAGLCPNPGMQPTQLAQ